MHLSPQNKYFHVPLVVYNILMYTSTTVRFILNVVRIIIFYVHILTYDHNLTDDCSI